MVVEADTKPQPLIDRESIKQEIVRVFKDKAAKALCIASHENGSFNPLRVNNKGNTPSGSRDRGIFQINSYWHSEVTDVMAFDARENIKQAYRISKQGTDWSKWSTNKYCN